MKIGDIVKRLDTDEEGTIISIKTRIGGVISLPPVEYGIDWFLSDSAQPHWNCPECLKVLK